MHLAKQFDQPPPPLQPEVAALLNARALLGGRIDWQALPVVAELIGFDDIEQLLEGLLILQDVIDAQASD